MPVLPSGRRVEFSLDRFHSLLEQMPFAQAVAVIEALVSPDDLFFVLDAVHFRLDDGAPYFASYVAADWKQYAAEWTTSDRLALEAWFASDPAVAGRRDALHYVRSLWECESIDPTDYPYVFSRETPSAYVQGRVSLQ